MTVRIMCCDVMDGLRQLPDESVHCVVTSPPYWGLRDYGVDGQIGLEASPDGFIEKMVEVFREVRRVLRSDGTCWMNLGDSYAGGGRGGGSEDCKQQTNVGSLIKAPKWSDAFHPGNPDKNGGASNRDGLGSVRGLKAKDLCGMPWRVAFALQADGWWLRSDIIWAKPNPMPESVTDRPTKSHEYVFLLTKSATYFYDSEAIKEAAAELNKFNGSRDRWTDKTGANGDRNDGGRGSIAGDGSRNKRSVWTIATSPFPEAHFATFPPELPEICILAGTSQKGCCAKCGAPWRREIATTGAKNGRDRSNKCDWIEGVTQGGNASGIRTLSGATYQPQRAATGEWLPSCTCNADVIPATVLDPFSGAGTTCLVADRLQRNGIGIELNPEYAAMSENRITGDAPLFAKVVAA